MKLTRPQKHALAALSIATANNSKGFYSRWELGRIARGHGSYPIKTMRSLQSHGLVVPQHEVAVGLVESGRCRCGCDVWAITDAGERLVKGFRVIQGSYWFDAR